MCRGVTLVEVVVALIMLGLLLPPIFQSFSQSRELAERQLNQEIGLKVAEGIINQAQGVEFSFLTNPPNGASMPFNFELPGNVPYTSQISFSGKPVQGSVSFNYAKTTFHVTLKSEKLFPISSGTPTITLSYADEFGKIATYPCPDNFMLLSAQVEFLSGTQTQTVSLKGTRTD